MKKNIVLCIAILAIFISCDSFNEFFGLKKLNVGKSIESFQLSVTIETGMKKSYNATINEVTKIIHIAVDYDDFVARVGRFSPIIEVSDGATVNPGSASLVDFTYSVANPIFYSVLSEEDVENLNNGDTPNPNVYKVTIEKKDNSEASILGANILIDDNPGLLQDYEAEIDQTLKRMLFFIRYNDYWDVLKANGVTVDLTLSAEARVTPEKSTILDLEQTSAYSTFRYIVESSDGSIENEYSIVIAVTQETMNVITEFSYEEISDPYYSYHEAIIIPDEDIVKLRLGNEHPTIEGALISTYEEIDTYQRIFSKRILQPEIRSTGEVVDRYLPGFEGYEKTVLTGPDGEKAGIVQSTSSITVRALNGDERIHTVILERGLNEIKNYSEEIFPIEFISMDRSFKVLVKNLQELINYVSLYNTCGYVGVTVRMHPLPQRTNHDSAMVCLAEVGHVTTVFQSHRAIPSLPIFLGGFYRSDIPEYAEELFYYVNFICHNTSCGNFLRDNHESLPQIIRKQVGYIKIDTNPIEFLLFGAFFIAPEISFYRSDPESGIYNNLGYRQTFLFNLDVFQLENEYNDMIALYFNNSLE